MTEHEKKNHVPTHYEEGGIDITEIMNEYGKPIIIPIAIGALSLWIGAANAITWLNIVGFIAVIWGCTGIYQRFAILQSGLPLILIALVVGGIFYLMQFWIGVFVAIGVGILGGYNLYGQFVDGAGSLIDTGVDKLLSGSDAHKDKKKETHRGSAKK